MRTITITKNVGFFNELSPELQEKVINKFRNTFVLFEPDFIVYDFTEYMKNIGVTVKEDDVHIESFSGQIYNIVDFMGDMDQYQKYFHSENLFKKFKRWVKFVNDNIANVLIRLRKIVFISHSLFEFAVYILCFFFKEVIQNTEEMVFHFFTFALRIYAL